MQQIVYSKVKIEAPRSDSTELVEVKLRGSFDRKKVCHFGIRSLTPQSRHGGTGNALAVAVQSDGKPQRRMAWVAGVVEYWSAGFFHYSLAQTWITGLAARDKQSARAGQYSITPWPRPGLVTPEFSMINFHDNDNSGVQVGRARAGQYSVNATRLCGQHIRWLSP